MSFVNYPCRFCKSYGLRAVRERGKYMSNKASNRKPLIVGIIAAVVILAALLGVLLTQCTPGGGGASTPETTAAKPVIENADLYWNVDRALYDGMSEGGMSSRRPESDGYFHVRFFKDGEFVELKVENRTIVNKLEVRDLMGLVFDDNGVVIDVIPIEDMPVQKIGWKFYVQSVGGHIIKVNSSNKFDGMEVLLDTKNGAKIYDMTGTMGAVGMETDAAINDRIMAVTDLEGELLAVYIYDRSNMQVEFQAYCQHCDKEATWIEWKNEKQLPKQEGHFQLVTDVKLNGQQSIQADMKICLDLNGHTVDGKVGSRVYSVHSLNSELAIMDTSEEQTGKLAAHGEIYAQGCVVWVRSGNCYMYGGTLDATDAVCTGRGGAAVYVAADRYFYLYGGEIIGGNAKYYRNPETGSYGNGLGGSVYNIGKFVMKDGVIRDGFAEAAVVWENGKTAYKRGLGGNVYVGSGGEFVMDGGSIQNGRSGSSGNIYLDGTAEFTMNGGSISGGVALNPGREGGNLNMGAKATFTMNGGSITYGTSHNNVGNVYCAGTFVMNSGYIAGGRAVDAQTGKVKEKAPTANLFVSNGGKLYMYGGTVQGQMAAVDSSTKDGKHTTIVLAGMPVIYADGAPGLTLQTGAEPVQLHVYDLHDLAKIGIYASGKFSLETKEANRDNFISNIEGAEVLYVDKCLGLGKLACLCGSEAHFGRCDGKELLWGPWTSKTSLPNTTGNYFLADDVSLTGNRSVGSSEKTDVVLSLDLNGKRIVSAQRVLTVYATLNLTDHVGGGRMVGAGLKSGDNHTGNMLMVAGSQLNIYGGTIALADDHYDLTSGGVMGIGNGAEVNLYGGVIDGRSADTENKIGNGGAVRLSGVLNVQGGEIYGGTANRAGTIYVEKTGVLNLFGGKIHGGTAEENGGALYVAGGKVNLSGGVISGGSAQEGGAVRMQASGQFNMTGGVIENGVSQKAGGNVSVYTGKFTMSGGEVRNGTGANGGNFAVNSQLDVTGGTVSGGKTSGNGYGGNIHTTNEAAVVNISGGTVTGGFAGNRGGNISGIGTLNISGGTVSAGNANNGGGNIESTLGATAVLNISGGVISGGLYKNEANTDRGNLYVTTGKLNISGSAVIDGGILLVNNAKTTISGEPQIIGEKFGIKLAGVNMAAPVITVGDLGGNAKIGLNHEGVFGVEGEAADTSKFIPADASFLVHHDAEDNTLYVGHVHCLCGNGEASWCDHKAVRWSKWDGKSSITEGNYYLAASVENTANVSVGTKDKTLNICLGGNTISTTNSRTLNINGNVSIFDHSETPGALIGTGGAPKVTEKVGVTTYTYEHSAVAVVAKDARLNLYNGTLKLAENHNQLGDMGGVMAVANGGEFHMYGGCVDASASLTSEKAIAAGGAIRVDGKVNIQGGTILGGKVTGNGGAILLRTATAEVNISGGTVSGGTANAGGAIHVADGVLNITGGTVENGISATKGGNINQVKGSVSISDKALIQNGKAAQGGNLAVTPADGQTVCQLSISGGQIKGGICSNAKGNDANLYVNNTVLKLSGGEIDGGVSVVNTSGTKAYVEMSGDPKIQKSGAVNLRLAKSGGTLPVVKIMGQLTGEPGSIGITGTLGVVATAGGSYTVTETDKAYFTSDDPAYRLRLNAADVELYVPHLHCWCENADTVPADHTCVDDQEWMPITGSKTIGDGFYYLDWTGGKAAAITVSAGKHAHLCLNNATIYAQKTITLGEGSTLTICDCGTAGLIGVSGGATRSPILLETAATVNLYSGSVTGRYNTTKSFAAVTLNHDSAVFNMYGGKLYCKQDGNVSGGNLTLTAGAANILGGTVIGGTNADSYGIAVAGGSLTLGGGLSVNSISLAEGKTITIASPLTGAAMKVDAAEGLFATGAVAADAEKFVDANGQYAVHFADGELYFMVQSCLCGAAKGPGADYAAAAHTDWCKESGQELLLWQPWDGTSRISDGNYYLAVNNAELKTSPCEIAAGKIVNLSLNGNSVKYSGSTRAFNVSGMLNITDWAATAGTLSSKGKTNDQAAVASVKDGGVLNLYRGTLALAEDHNALNNLGGVAAVITGGVMNIYDGCVDAAASLATDAKTVGSGAALRVSGELNVYGGTVIGGKVTGNGGAIYLNNDAARVTIDGGTVAAGSANKGDAICLEKGTLTIGGNAQIGEIYFADGKRVTVKDDLTATAPIPVTMNTAGVFAVAESGKELTYEGKARFVSTDADLNVAFTGVGYALTDGPVGCLCGKTDGTHEDYCTKLDPVAWTGTGLPTETGNYYLTAPVAVEAATTVAADKHIKLWLQGNDITVAEGKSINNIFMVKAGASLALMDTTGNGVVDGLVEGAAGTGTITEHIVENEGSLVLDGAKLDAGGLSLGQNGLAVRVIAGGSLTVKSGHIVGGTSTSTNDNGGGAIYGQGNSVITVEGGTITGGTAKVGGNISSRGTIIITGGSITNGAYTSRGGNVYAQGGGSISISGSTTIISGGYSSTDSTKALKDRSNVVGWNADVTLTDVTLEGGVWVTGNRTCTLSGNVVVNGDGVGLTLGATSDGGTTARVVIGEDFETTSTVDLAIAVWAKKAGNIYASGLTEAQADVFAIHTADVVKRQETGKDTWEIVHP